MKILAPISSRDELEMLMENGAEELYCGVVPSEWLARYSGAECGYSCQFGGGCAEHRSHPVPFGVWSLPRDIAAKRNAVGNREDRAFSGRAGRARGVHAQRRMCF